MYTELYNKLSQDHRQQMQAEAARRRMARHAPRQHRQPGPSGLGRHAIGRIGAVLVALGSRLEQVERSGLPSVSPASTANNNR